MAEIAVLIPCYNEAATIARVVAEYKAALPQAKIYVYDNNSTDGSDQIASQAGAIVRHERRQGKGNVIRSMFMDIDADVYIMTDGDDTYPASAAPQMARCVLEERCDMVIGDRLSTTYFAQNKRAFHNSGNKLVKFLINKLFNAHIKDIMTGYRAFSRSFVKHFPLLSKGFEIETEMTVHALDKNFLIKEVEIDYRDRPQGSSSKLNTFTDGLKILKTIFVLFRDYRPLLFFSMAALLFFVVGIGMVTPVLVEYMHTGLVPRFPTLIVSCFIILFSMLMLSVGLILEVMVKHHRYLYELHLHDKH